MRALELSTISHGDHARAGSSLLRERSSEYAGQVQSRHAGTITREVSEGSVEQTYASMEESPYKVRASSERATCRRVMAAGGEVSGHLPAVRPALPCIRGKVHHGCWREGVL